MFPNRFHYFLPTRNHSPVLDSHLHQVGVLPNPGGLRKRLLDRVANTAKVCTSERHIIEQSFARVYNFKMSGNTYPVPHQLLEPCGVPPCPNLPKIELWLEVMAAFRRSMTPYNLKYPLVPGVSYGDHGKDLVLRLEKENVL